MKHPHIHALALALALAMAATGPALAQTVSASWNPRTGDVWVDQRLDDINRYGTRYREPFINELVRYHAAPRALVTDLLVNRGWSPGDVYYACSIAHVLGVPCANVAEQWQRDRGQGWGVVAQRMGIKPGSAEFHRLKKGFVPSYDRWGRPVVLDRDLERAYPERAKRAPNGGSAARPAHAGGHAAPQGQARGKPPAGASGKARGNSQGNGKAKGHGRG